MKDLVQFTQFLTGERSELKEFKDIQSDLEQRFGTAISVVTIANLTRVASLQQKLKNIEETVFDEKVIANMDVSEQLKVIGLLHKLNMDTLEFTRKFASQNKELFSTVNQESDRLARMIDSLPAAKRSELIKSIEKLDQEAIEEGELGL